MNNTELKYIAIIAVSVLLITVASILAGYTKAKNDQAYLQIVQNGMSEEGFEEYMTDKLMARSPG